MTETAAGGPLPAISEVGGSNLRDWLGERRQPGYRADQILGGVDRGPANGFADLTVLPLSLRADLTGAFAFSSLTASRVVATEGGGTAKAVHLLADGQRIESVRMTYGPRGAPTRTTICISSQAGCAVACPFCATGQAGFGRQLSAAEIVDQVLFWRRQAADPAAPHTNIVFMGMGEPLNNTERVFEAVRILNDPARLGIGARHITVSTSGVVPNMERMVDELPQVNLAVSLHAADDDLRDELVPINRKWPIARVLEAARGFAQRTGRRVSLEYVLIAGVNDNLDQATALGRLATGWLSHVNLIPLNPTPDSAWAGSSLEQAHRFADGVRSEGVAVTLRDTRGRSIEAACGQLHAQLSRRQLLDVSEPLVLAGS